MDRKQQVLEHLKPKVKAFGFNKKELMSVAAKIADNLTSAEDASEEDVNAEIDAQIDAVLPYLQVSQSFANRVIEENRRKNDDNETDGNASATETNPRNKGRNNEQEPAWFKAYRETQEARIAALEGEKTLGARRSKLEALLKDTGTFGARIMKTFDRMKFDSDADYEEYYADVEADLKAYNQECANEGLSTLGTPPKAGEGKQARTEVLTDKEVDDLVGTF